MFNVQSGMTCIVARRYITSMFRRIKCFMV